MKREFDLTIFDVNENPDILLINGGQVDFYTNYWFGRGLYEGASAGASAAWGVWEEFANQL